MFRNKLLQLSVILLIAVTLIIVAVFVLLNFPDNSSATEDPHQQAINSVGNVGANTKTAQEVSDTTVEIKDIVTNLANKDFIKISFAFEMDTKKAREEFELLQLKIRAKIIETLATLNPDQLQGVEGRDSLIATLMNKVNPIMSEGKIQEIDITDIQLP